MQDRDRELLSRHLWGGHHGYLRVPLYEPMPLAPCPETPPMVKFREAELDFHAKDVKIPASSLSFDDVRRIWEAIVLYSEVS